MLTFIPSEVKELDFWSDGPSNQFKNRYAAAMLNYFEEQMKISIKWNYFATSHGKGPVDGVGAIIKRFVWQKILTRKQLVHDVPIFLAATEGCEIEAIGKTKEKIAEQIQSLDLETMFTNAPKIPDISNKNFIQYIDGTYKTKNYTGKYFVIQSGIQPKRISNSKRTRSEI